MTRAELLTSGVLYESETSGLIACQEASSPIIGAVCNGKVRMLTPRREFRSGDCTLGAWHCRQRCAHKTRAENLRRRGKIPGRSELLLPRGPLQRDLMLRPSIPIAGGR